jgi:hypothetical protein
MHLNFLPLREDLRRSEVKQFQHCLCFQLIRHLLAMYLPF